MQSETSQTHLDRTEISRGDAPFIITAALADADFAFFDAVRKRHFPPERNFIPAHITLFHAMPATERARVFSDLAEIAATHDDFAAEVRAPVSTGRGVAFPIAASELAACHRALQNRWHSDLRPQDLQGYRPHIVAQNKVDAATAHATLAELTAQERPQSVHIVGLDLWMYLGGPWEYVRRFAFAGAADVAEDHHHNPDRDAI